MPDISLIAQALFCYWITSNLFSLVYGLSKLIEVFWHDSTGSMEQLKSTVDQCLTNSPLSKMLCNVYLGLHYFFVTEFGIAENPPFLGYLQSLLKLSSTILPSQAAKTVFQVFEQWNDGMESRILSTLKNVSVSSAVPDATFLEILLYKLKLCRSISYAIVAAHADQTSRRKLAAMLVEHEPLSSKQVPLLLGIGEEDTALTKATESGDTDLVYLVLFHIWQKWHTLHCIFSTRFVGISHSPISMDGYVTCFSGLIQTALYADFFYYYFIRKVGKAIPSFNCQHEHHLPGLAFEASIASMSFNFQHEHHQASIPFLPFICRLMICQECSDYFPKIPHRLDPHVAAEGTALVKQAEDVASNKRLQVDPATWPIMIFRVC
ncbi:hypothetical protein Lser_V15G12935 [Lactuca serriola]